MDTFLVFENIKAGLLTITEILQARVGESNLQSFKEQALCKKFSYFSNVRCLIIPARSLKLISFLIPVYVMFVWMLQIIFEL